MCVQVRVGSSSYSANGLSGSKLILRIRLLRIVFCKIIWEVVALCWGDVLDRWYKAFQITEAGVPGSNRVATVSQLDITLKTGKVTMWV